MIIEQKRYWNLYFKTSFYFIFNWSVYPGPGSLISSTKSGTLARVRLKNPSQWDFLQFLHTGIKWRFGQSERAANLSTMAWPIEYCWVLTTIAIQNLAFLQLAPIKFKTTNTIFYYKKEQRTRALAVPSHFLGYLGQARLWKLQDYWNGRIWGEI